MGNAKWWVLGILAVVLIVRSPDLVKDVFHDGSQTVSATLSGCNKS